MSKKKTAINASLIQCSTRKPPTYICQILKYFSPRVELVSKSATLVQMISKMPLDFSDSKKSLKVFDNFLCTTLTIVFRSKYPNRDALNMLKSHTFLQESLSLFVLIVALIAANILSRAGLQQCTKHTDGSNVHLLLE
jgi:hypothetical protein